MTALATLAPPAEPTRPVLRYLGGKWRLAPWIIGHFPRHRVYVEPFGGAASVLLRKERAHIEVYNDLDGELVNLFRILRSPDAAALVRQVSLTPYARAEYLGAWQHSSDPLERARRLLIRSHMGHGTRGTRIDRTSRGFRRDGRKATTRVAGEWGEFPEALQAIVDRLAGVELDCRPASALIEDWDDPKALIYLDPPYPPETRSTKAKSGDGYHTYAYEMSLADHEALLDQIVRSRAMVAISSYASPLYEGRLRHWSCRQTGARAHRNAERTEMLWLNPACVAALHREGSQSRGLFDLDAAE